MCADLVAGPAPAAYDPRQWPAPPRTPFAIPIPAAPYAVMHVGASTPLKQWAPQRIAQVAAHLHARGITPVWSAGRGEQAIVRACDPDSRYPSVAGALDLAQMWHLLAGAALLVAPDTGVAHLGRLVDDLRRGRVLSREPVSRRDRRALLLP